MIGRYVDPKAGSVTLADFAAQWLEAQTFDASTRETMESRVRTHILPTIGDMELRHLKPSTVQAWVRSRQTEVAPSYCRLLLSNLSTVLSAAVEDGLIPLNPCSVSSVKAPRVDRRRVVPWSVETAQRVVECHPAEFRAVPVLGTGCELRQGEIFGLTVENIDFLRRVVFVRRQLRLVENQTVFAPPKGGREREVPLPDVVSMALAEHIRAFGQLRSCCHGASRAATRSRASCCSPTGTEGRSPGLISATTRGNQLWLPGSIGAGRRGCTLSVTTTPQCSSTAGCLFGWCPSTWAITTRASPCAPTPI